MDYIFFTTALAVAFLWGVQAIILKLLLKRLDKFTIMTLTSIIYMICLAIYNWFYPDALMKDLRKLTQLEIFWIVVSSCFCLFLANVLYYKSVGSQTHPTAFAVALAYSSPMFALILGYFILNEKVRSSGIFGTILILLGIFFVARN